MELGRPARDVSAARALVERLVSIDERFGARARPVLQQRGSELADTIERFDDGAAASSDERGEVSGRAAGYAGEALAAYAGALSRADGGSDAELCATAETMLDEIAESRPQWRGLPVILGAAESYTGSSGLVRLRFPTESIWGLPLVAHEHGHHVALTLTELQGAGLHQSVRSTVVHWADEEQTAYDDVSARSHLFELFADVYATWVLGAAYPAALIELRLDATTAFDGTMRHPPGAVRVDSALTVLRTMDRPDDLWHPYRSSIEKLEKDWNERIGRRNGAGRRDFDTGTRRLSDLLDLCRRALADARHDPKGVARWEKQLRTTTDPLDIQPSDRVSDVVAALWRTRLLRNPDPAELRRLEARALEACHDVVQQAQN